MKGLIIRRSMDRPDPRRTEDLGAAHAADVNTRADRADPKGRRQIDGIAALVDIASLANFHLIATPAAGNSSCRKAGSRPCPRISNQVGWQVMPLRSKHDLVRTSATFGIMLQSASSIHTGAWSLAPSSPRTSRSMPAPTSRRAAFLLSSRWSSLRPAFRCQRFRL